MSRLKARFRVPRPAAGRAGSAFAALIATLIVAVAAVAICFAGDARAAPDAATPGPATCPTPKAAAATTARGDVFNPALTTARGDVFNPARPVNQRRAVTLIFLPGPIRTPAPELAADLERLPGFAVGLFSPTIGRYSPAQMMLDISQGSRAASSLYRPVSPLAPGLIVDPRTAAARFKDWNALIARADAAPADLHPGLLGCAVEQAGDYMAWTGADGGSTETAIAAVAGGNGIRRADIVPSNRLVASIERLQREFAVVVAELPAGGFGLGAIRRLAADQPRRMLIVVQAPPNPARTRLLSLGVRGIGDDGGVRSASTRRDGLVAATDITATIIERIDAARPSTMQGRPIEPAARTSAGDLRSMSARLELIAGRRLPFGKDVLLLFALLLAGVLAVGRISGRHDEPAKRMQRLVGLSLLWLPALLLVTAALRPSRAVEVDVAVFGSLALAIGTDRLIRWPRAPWLPVAVVIAAHGIDFALLGSRFTGQSLLGSNPLYGARFFGAGNELEAVLTVS
ncbi:MAG: hypothetical protein JJE27_05160, partial [Thermoleophilia bacterium]|nr:hypothetical protein [Thermoleophilia bacterium]